MKISRHWAMPSPETFRIAPIRELLEFYVPQGEAAAGPLAVIDPFCGGSAWAQTRNDLAGGGMEAIAWLDSLEGPARFDVALLDPPYSPRQIAEVYKSHGLAVSTTETQNARLYRNAKDRLHRLLRPGGLAICCGWNSAGFGVEPGYEMLEVLLVAHGAAHNDTIVTVERKSSQQEMAL